MPKIQSRAIALLHPCLGSERRWKGIIGRHRDIRSDHLKHGVWIACAASRATTSVITLPEAYCSGVQNPPSRQFAGAAWLSGYHEVNGQAHMLSPNQPSRRQGVRTRKPDTGLRGAGWFAPDVRDNWRLQAKTNASYSTRPNTLSAWATAVVGACGPPPGSRGIRPPHLSSWQARFQRRRPGF